MVPVHYYASVCQIFNDDDSEKEVRLLIDSVDLSSSIKSATKELNRVWKSIDRIQFCIPEDYFELFKTLKDHLDNLKNNAVQNAQQLLQSFVPCIFKDRLRLLATKTAFINDDLNDFNKLTEILEKTKKKARFIRMLLDDGIRYLGENDHIDNYTKWLDVHVFMLFIKETFCHETIFENVQYLYKLMKEYKNDAKYLIVDLDVNVRIEGVVKPHDSVIYHYYNKFVSYDVVRDRKGNADNNFMRGESFSREFKRQSFGVFKLRCPGNLENICGNKIRTWKCYECRKTMEYGFNKRIYCDCGSVDVEDVEFRCGDYRHSDFIPFEDKSTLEKWLEGMEKLQELNILLIGQSGVGKSTFINTLVNYLSFKSLAESEKKKAVVLIPTRFTIYRANVDHEVKVGEDDNEVTAVGCSATQGCTTYTLITKEKVIRLIDSPGMGDTDGYEKDEKNIQDIVSHLLHFKVIHGICFLLKPNESRSEACFMFSLKQLFCFLHVKASKNIIFCFTNSRSTNYRPGDSFKLIQKFIENTNARYLNLHTNNTYYFDSESFRFLCALRSGLTFPDNEREIYGDSWERSVEETNRLIKYISTLEPYDMPYTKIISEMRFRLSNTMDVIYAIENNDNLRTIKSYEDEIEDSEKRIAELENNLMVDKVVIEKNRPLFSRINAIVCTSSSCTEMFGSEVVYTTKCCRQCHSVSSARYHVAYNVELRQCSKLRDLNCRTCGCRWENHILINYEQVKVIKKVEDVNVRKQIDSLIVKKWHFEKKLQSIENSTERQNQEKQKYIDFAFEIYKYVKDTGLILCNDSFGDYLAYLIQLEENKPNKTEEIKTKIKALNDVKKKHDREMEIVKTIKESKDLPHTPVPEIIRMERSDRDLNVFRTRKNQYSLSDVHREQILCL